MQVGSYDPLPNYNKEVLVGLNLDRIKCGTCTTNKYIHILSLTHTYTPLHTNTPSHTRTHIHTHRYWLSVGAQPTIPVYRLLGLVRAS